MQQEKKVGVIGLGNMGSAIAQLCAENGHQVTGWIFERDLAKKINQTHNNDKYLPGVVLDSKITATHIVEMALQKSDVVFVALPSVYIRQTLEQYAAQLPASALVVNLSKGIEPHTCLTIHELLCSFFPDNEVLVLSGPSIATEFSQGGACSVVVAGRRQSDLFTIASVLETPTFRTRFSDDLIGVQWCGILKNVYAIGLGLIDGVFAEQSKNFNSAFLTKALDEMVSLITALGGKRETVYYLAGLGDLLATSLSLNSHNRQFGKLLAQGKSVGNMHNNATAEPEGLSALRMVVYLAEKHCLTMPLAQGLLSVIENKITAQNWVNNHILFSV